MYNSLVMIHLRRKFNIHSVTFIILYSIHLFSIICLIISLIVLTK